MRSPHAPEYSPHLAGEKKLKDGSIIRLWSLSKDHGLSTITTRATETFLIAAVTRSGGRRFEIGDARNENAKKIFRYERFTGLCSEIRTLAETGGGLRG